MHSSRLRPIPSPVNIMPTIDTNTDTDAWREHLLTDADAIHTALEQLRTMLREKLGFADALVATYTGFILPEESGSGAS